MDEGSDVVRHDDEELARGALGPWWRQGVRTAFFRRPDWSGLQTTPTVVAVLVLVPFAFGLLAERLSIGGPALFHWQGLNAGWLATAGVAWLCWLIRPHASPHAGDGAPSAAALFAMLSAQALPVMVLAHLVLVPFARGAFGSVDAPTVQRAWWGLWLGTIVWSAAAAITLLRRGGPRPALRRTIASLVFVGLTAAMSAIPQARWYPDRSVGDAADASLPRPFELTQEQFEAQAASLARGLQSVSAQRPGIVDVYAITFAPYEGDEVFRRESQLVADVMQSRFDARGRSLQLVNHRDTGKTLGWATPANLQRAILRAASQMDRNEDVLFIHLTSHGGRDGKLAASFWPLTVESLTPETLKRWLDDAGIRYRVVSVSACYSGSWIEPLSGPGTLVMTAADATHTSYGCGSRSDLTYFGRAVYDEQLRSTWSFEEAHTAARGVIERREHEAGKSDGYSNPQIAIGVDIRPVLARLASERAAATP